MVLFCLKKISALLSSPQGMLQLFRGFLYSSVLPGGHSACKFVEVTGSVDSYSPYGEERS